MFSTSLAVHFDLIVHASARKRASERLPSAITGGLFSICSTTTQQTTQNSSSLSPQHDARTWLDGLNSPLIQDEGDSKMLKLRFDVSQYTPEEIVVKTVDNKLLVSGMFARPKLRLISTPVVKVARTPSLPVVRSN